MVYEIIPISLGRKCHPLSNTQPTRGPCFFHCSHGEVSSNLSVFPSLTSGTVQALKDRISDATSSCANRLEQIEYMSNIYIYIIIYIYIFVYLYFFYISDKVNSNNFVDVTPPTRKFPGSKILRFDFSEISFM